MKTTLAIDPGIRGCGVALFQGDSLQWASYVKNPETKGNGPNECKQMAFAIISEIGRHASWIHRLVMEWPQIYTHGKGDNNDLLALAGVDAALASVACADEIIHYLPRQWKGQLPKDVCNARIEKTLTPEELGHFGKFPQSLRHNVLDAVGIGLFSLGRFGTSKTT